MEMKIKYLELIIQTNAGLFKLPKGNIIIDGIKMVS
jgi:hypothetical protein